MNHGELQLYDHQVDGVEWMLQRETCDRHKAGLLLDGCGLGKTPQMCATLMRNPQPTTLLVLPVNLISQWKAALGMWCPSLRVAVFHGGNVPKWDGIAAPARYFSFLARHQGDATGDATVSGPLVVLTSYGKVVDRKFEKRRRRLKKARKLKDPSAMGSTVLHKMVWDRIVLDEAHVIRNRLTVRTRYVLALRGTIKWALTATPIHNGIQDYQCLLQFLGLSDMEIVRLFASHPVLERYLTETARLLVSGKVVSLDDNDKRAWKRPCIRHEEITLRRTKKVLQGKKRARGDDDDDGADSEAESRKVAKTLPPLHVHIVFVPMATQDEQYFYRNLERATRIELLRFEEDEGRGIREAREQFMFELILRLRQASVNPRLVLTGYKRKFGGTFPMQLLLGSLPPAMLRARSRRDIQVAERVFYERLGMPSKTRALIDMLSRHKREKSIVFCEFSEEMPLLSADLEAHGFKCAIYNGSMTCKARDAVVARLSWTDNEVQEVLGAGFFGRRCFVPREIAEHIAQYASYNVVLIQINSGNAGLNLQMCSRVYFTNPSWNPCTEEQALGRAHRCGQEREVHAVKLVGVTAGQPPAGATIDNRVLEVQVAKRKVMADILNDDEILFNGTVTTVADYGATKLTALEMRNLILGNE